MFSCPASQFRAFMNRSRLPTVPRNPFDAKSESPIATTRVSGFFGSSSFVASTWFSGLGGEGASGAVTETAAPRGIGPVLSPLAASDVSRPVVSSDLMSVSAQLRGLVSMIGCAVRPLTPPDTGVMDRAIGYTVNSSNRSTTGCEGYGGIATGSDGSLLRPLTSTTMSLPASIPQSCSNATRFVSGAASGRVGGSSMISARPPRCR